MAKKKKSIFRYLLLADFIVISVVIISILVLGVVVTEHDWFFYKKQNLSFEDTYIDTRSWSVMDYADNPYITELLLKRGYNKVIDEMKL